VEFLRHLLREPCEFSGTCLFWVRSLPALRLLEEKGADTRDLGWMGIPLLVHMAEQGHIDIVRFLVEERGHDPSGRRMDGHYTALHWAKGPDVVRYLPGTWCRICFPKQMIRCAWRSAVVWQSTQST
jgi:hypothetical protein